MRIVTIARKPFEGSATQNCAEHGCGALHIDGCRIAGPSWKWGTQTDIRGGAYNTNRPSDGHVFARNVESNPAGRWPANVILQHQPGCECVGTKKVKPGNGSGVTGPGAHGFQTQYVGDVAKGSGFQGTYVDDDGTETVAVAEWVCVEGCAVQDLGDQNGVTTSGAMKRTVGSYDGSSMTGFLRGNSGPHNQHGDTGTAARFFKQVKP